MLRKRVFLASAVLTGGQFVVRLLDVVAGLVIARFLAPADFGVVMIATATLVMLRAFTELPVAEALVRAESVDKRDLDSAFTLTVLRGILIAALLCAASLPMAHIFDDERLVGLLCALAIVPIALGLRSPAMVHLTRDIEFRPISAIEVVSKLVAFGIAVWVAWSTGSYWALTISLLVPPLVSFPATYVVAPYRPRFGLGAARTILSFAGWMTLSRAISTANLEIDRYLVGGVLGKTAVGLFSVGRSVSSTVSWAIGMPLMQALFAGFSTFQNDRERLHNAYRKGQAMLAAAIMPIGFALSVLADPLVRLALGEQWLGAIPIIAILAPVGALQTMVMPVQALVLAIGQPRQLTIRDAILFAIGVPAVIVAAIQYGLLGAVVMRAVLGLFQIALGLEIVRRNLGDSFIAQIRPLWRTALSVACMVAAMLLVQNLLPPSRSQLQLALDLAITVAAGGLTYVVAHAALWQFVGRPDGPERFALGLCSAALRKSLQVMRAPAAENG